MRTGETLFYSLSWGFLGKAATLSLSTQKNEDGNFVVTTKAASQGFARSLYPFEANSVAVYQHNSGQLLELDTSATSPKFQYKTHTLLDHEKHLAQQNHNGIASEFSLPESLILDVSTLIAPLRDFPIQPGSTKDITLFFEGKIYPVTLCAMTVQRIKTPLFTRNAVLFQPRMNPKLESFIKRESDIKIWISDDLERLPLAFEARVKHGTVKGTLFQIT